MLDLLYIGHCLLVAIVLRLEIEFHNASDISPHMENTGLDVELLV